MSEVKLHDPAGGESAPILTLDEAERRHILAALEQLGWDKPRAAEALGCCLKTLYNKLNRYEAQGHLPGGGRPAARGAA